MIRCSHCHVPKPEDEFYRNRSRSTGRSDRCILCRQEARPAYDIRVECCWCDTPFRPHPSRPLHKYCSRRCKSAASMARKRERRELLGICTRCGAEAWPYATCDNCRAYKRQLSRGDRERRKCRPRINHKMFPPQVLDAIKRFESVTEGVWRSDPASTHTI